MILSPIFMLPLETAGGGEHPTMQLLEIKKQEAQYSFNFERLDRWVGLCLHRDVQYFENKQFYNKVYFRISDEPHIEDLSHYHRSVFHISSHPEISIFKKRCPLFLLDSNCTRVQIF
jgi:hypothetical protein